MILRDYQQTLHDEIHSAWAVGHLNVLAVLPTGGGKTVTFAHIVKEESGASVVLAHRGELVVQMSLALAREKVCHRVIGPPALARMCVNAHIAELQMSFVNPNAKTAVGSVQSVATYKDGGWFDQVRLWVHDECFPAGTLIDGTPIETVQIGDMVNAFNEITGKIELRKVVRLFKNIKPKHMMRIVCGKHHVLNCTLGHPFYTKRGWIEAGNLTIYDEVLSYVTEMHGLPNGARLLGVENHSVEKTSKNLLFKRVFGQVSLADIINYDGGNKSEICVSKNVSEESNAESGNTQENERYPEIDWSQTISARGQWETSNRCRSKIVRDVRASWLYKSIGDKNRLPGDLPAMLQGGFGESNVETSDRSGRSEPLWETTSGQEKGRFLEWVRVDRVEIQEQSDNGSERHGDSDSYVYNLEVDGLHTYVANGIVVHNCHHLLRDGQFGKAVARFKNARGLGVTATPGRADGAGLGRHADGLFDVMVMGPTPRDLIERGFLSPYKIFAPPSTLDLSHVRVTASGDYSPPELKTATQKSTVLGDTVLHYAKHAVGMPGLTFADSIDNAVDIAARYRAIGVSAEVLTGKTQDALRSNVITRFKNRQLNQIVSVALIDEGFDCPGVMVVSDAAATQSFNRFAQRFGRGMRIMEGKTHMIYMDHVGNTLRHGLPDRPRYWTLDRRDRKSNNTKSEIPLRICTECYQPYPRTSKKCPYCGHYPEPASRSGPEFVDGDLLELDEDTLRAMRGEIARINRDPVVPRNLDPIAQAAIRKRHWARQGAQNTFRNTIAWWAGLQHAQGMSESESMRAFYFKFGIDVGTAQTLGEREVLELVDRVNVELLRNGIDGSVNANVYLESL